MVERVFRALAFNGKSHPRQVAMRMGDVVLGWADLASHVAKLSSSLTNSEGFVGIDCSSPLASAVVDLAVTHAGRVSVHLPSFFSPEQKRHIVGASGIGTIIGDGPTYDGIRHIAAPSFRLPCTQTELPPATAGAKRIIFTSGSSGTPKGVVIGDKQMSASLEALAQTIVPQQDDRHLSLLPMAQLLEQIAGLYLPVLTGTEVVFSRDAADALFGGPIAPVLDLMQVTRPTTTILVPALLSRLVAFSEETKTRPPNSLRFVAVGGAPSTPAILAKAEACGFPVYAGYGLSECSSVVAMNRPEEARHDTVGPVLPGVTVRIDAGEIVVSGPTVMEGYLGHPPTSGEWRTGDLGRIEDGQLIFEGRKDWLIVTPAGRNIAPEWVEARLSVDPRIPAAGLHLEDDGSLTIVAVLAAPVHTSEIAGYLRKLPDYARPKRVVRVPMTLSGFLKIGGGIDRSRLGAICAGHEAQELYYDMEVDA